MEHLLKLHYQAGGVRHKSRDLLATCMLRDAIRKGRLERARVCSGCGVVTRFLRGHHFDYSKPLEVLWLCTKCHVLLHKALDREIRSEQIGTGDALENEHGN